MMQRPSLAGQTVLLIHSGDGLGSVLAIAFAQAGARIIIHDRSTAVVASAVERLLLAVPGVSVTGIDAQLDSVNETHAMLARVGAIDILVIDALSADSVDFAQLPDEASNPRRNTRQDQAQACIRQALPEMVTQGAGRIFLLLLAPSSAGSDAGLPPLSVLPIPYEPFGVSDHEGVKAYAVTLPDLILAPVADLMKSEVMRTNRSFADIADQFVKDHRPAGIQAASKVIQEVVGQVLALGASPSATR
jgi:NAD(P)-dependent dehydrogenase (short-subunit alcohol dehydrogenase family)